MTDGREIVCTGIQVNYLTMTEAGDVIDVHAHPYEHSTAVLTGSVLVLPDEVLLKAGDDPVLHFPAGREHGFRALEPSTLISVIDTTQATWDPTR